MQPRPDPAECPPPPQHLPRSHLLAMRSQQSFHDTSSFLVSRVFPQSPEKPPHPHGHHGPLPPSVQSPGLHPRNSCFANLANSESQVVAQSANTEQRAVQQTGVPYPLPQVPQDLQTESPPLLQLLRPGRPPGPPAAPQPAQEGPEDRSQPLQTSALYGEGGLAAYLPHMHQIRYPAADSLMQKALHKPSEHLRRLPLPLRGRARSHLPLCEQGQHFQPSVSVCPGQGMGQGPGPGQGL